MTRRWTEAEYHAWQIKQGGGFPPAPQKQHPWAGKSTAGFRPDLGHFCRSRWEANLARFYRYMQVEYVYEPCEFWFPVERGVRTYIPDFWLPEEDLWVEVKGFMTARSKTQLNRFRKYYPAERLEVITGPFFAALVKKGVPRLIEGWE